MRRISKDITKHYQMACSSGELHAICFLWAHVFYVLILPIRLLGGQRINLVGSAVRSRV